MDENMIPMSVEDAFKVFGAEVPETIDHPELSVDEALSVLGQNEPEHDLQ